MYGFKKQQKKNFQRRSVMGYPTPQKKRFLSKKLSLIFTRKNLPKRLYQK
jgi:hypothetical protein